MRLMFCLALCLMQKLSYANANEGKYTVIAPGTIHSNDKYTASVAVRHVSQPCQIKVGITGPSYNESKQVEVSENEVKNVEFYLPTLETGDYNITAEGVNCLNSFKNTTRLIHNKFKNHVKIQTDKGIYKPGDDINFRVLFMDKDLKPAQPEKDAVIWLEDGKRNRIEEIRDFKTIKGVYTGKFKISEFPVSGEWRLGVKNVVRFDRHVQFRVSDYVLPKYEVKVEATGDVSVKDGDLQVIVRANYTYGKPLDGKATVLLSLGSYYYEGYWCYSDISNTKIPTLTKTVTMVKGKAKVDLNVKEYEPFLPYKNSPSFMTIVATVEDRITGAKVNGTSFAFLYPYRYAMQCLSYPNSSTFEAGKRQNVLFQVTYVDGTHLNDTKSTVKLIYKEVLSKKYWYSLTRHSISMKPPVVKNLTVAFSSRMNETGFVNFRVYLPDLPEYEGYSHYYSFELEYLNEKHELNTTHQYREPKNVEKAENDEKDEEQIKYFMLLDKQTSHKKLDLNKAEQFTLKSSQLLSYFDFNIIGRGNILKSGRVHLPDRPKVYNFTLTPERSWAPTFSIYAYYVDETGEYHSTEQKYRVNFELQNEITLNVAEQVRPGEEVALKIQTTPNSFVGLIAVDISALLLRSNKDFTSYEFDNAMDSYSTTTPPQGGDSKYPGTISGCVTLTNADYIYNLTNRRYSYYNSNRKTVVKRSAPMAPADQGKIRFSSMMASSSVGAGDVTSVEKVKDFSETWLFTDIENTENAEFTLSKKIPETLTSWVFTAFSMHPTKGLGFTRGQTKIKTFLPFFISIRLPHSVKPGENFDVPVLIFNYYENALEVNVTLENNDNEVEFIAFDNEVISDQKQTTKSIIVPVNGVAEVSFLLRPKNIGKTMLTFKAISALAGDVKYKSLRVVPDGVTQYVDRTYFVDLNKERKVKTFFELNLPEDAVSGSEYVEVGVTGDLLGPVFNNLDNLVRLPTGCGEHTMSALISKYLVMKYLQNCKRLTPIIETKLLYNLKSGYQSMLNYRQNDGSFSTFGLTHRKENPSRDSTWFTAYVVRFLQQIKEFVNIEDKIIDDGLAYLFRQQAPNGSFTEKDNYFYASQRNHVTITGAVVLAFQGSATSAEKYSQEIKKALDFIARNIDKTDSLHVRAVGTYTLNKAKHAAAKENLSKLKSLARTGSDRMWWSTNYKPIIGRDVEITSYTLLALLDQDSTKLDDVLPIINWLIAQRNSNGGFYSTQDTVVGLMALIEFAKFANYKPAKMNVNIKSDNENHMVKLTENKEFVYQSIEMSPKTKFIQFTAKGTGTALVKISYQYNRFEKESQTSFTIKTKKIKNNNKASHLQMLTCVNYVGKGKSSNMAVLEISTPSGFVIDHTSLNDIMKIKRVGNAEMKNSDSMLVVFFDHLLRNHETCLTFDAFRTHAVAMQRPASIVLYDYYDTSKKETTFYEV